MWWPRTLRVGLANDRLFLAGGAAPRRADACREIPLAAAGDGPAWQPALRALADELAAGRQPVKALHVVLAGHHVHWKLLAIPPGVNTAGERAAFAGFAFRQTYGEIAADWRIEVAAQPPAWPQPACAVAGGLIDGLARVGAEANVRLASVTPYFAAAFDHWRGRLRGEPLWFCLHEPETLTLGLAAGGRWLGLQTGAHAGDWPDVLARMQAQLAIPAGVSTARLHLLSRADPPPAAASAIAAVVLAPPAHWPGAAGRCRMAYGV